MLWECTRTFSFSPATRKAAACKFLDNLSPVGQNPLDKILVTTAWAGASHAVQTIPVIP